jgi:hypothetical protein
MKFIENFNVGGRLITNQFELDHVFINPSDYAMLVQKGKVKLEKADEDILAKQQKERMKTEEKKREESKRLKG